MSDHKRLLREMKRDLKKDGNRKRRRFLRDVTSNPEDFAFGESGSARMNNRPRVKRTRKT